MLKKWFIIKLLFLKSKKRGIKKISIIKIEVIRPIKNLYDFILIHKK